VRTDDIDDIAQASLRDVGLAPKSIDNSQVVREVDPRSSRDLWLLVALVAALAGGLGLYAWPTLMMRRTGTAAEQLSRERERLVEENRKLRLEKASLEDLRRVETIATRELGLATPEPERLVVVERPAAVPEGARLASRDDAARPPPDTTGAQTGQRN
jgi:cell division protein FtsL